MSIRLVEAREEMTVIGRRLEELMGIKDRSSEQNDEAKQLMERMKPLKETIDFESALEAQVRQARELEAPRGAVADVQPRGGEQRRTKIDLRSIGQKYVDSEQFKDYRKDPRGKGERFDVGSFHHRDSVIEHSDDLSPDELRTLVYTGALPADMILPQQVPGIFRGIEAPLNMRDVLINGRTQSDSVTFMRELAFTNNAAEVAQAVDTSSGAKPESAITFEQATATVVTIAHWIPITRQTMEDAAQLVTYVNQRLLVGLERREDNQILNGNGTGANMTGILNTTGVQTANGAHFTGSPVNNNGTDNENFERIRRGKRLVRVTGQAMPNFVVLHPTKLEELETTVDANRQYFVGNIVTGAQPQTLWGLRVVESENIATTTALVGDGSMAAIWDRMDAQIYTTDSHSDFFVRNIFVLLAEERLALTVFRPAAFCAVTLL
jgi:HK97 family phage major capsid protein